MPPVTCIQRQPGNYACLHDPQTVWHLCCCSIFLAFLHTSVGLKERSQCSLSIQTCSLSGTANRHTAIVRSRRNGMVGNLHDPPKTASRTSYSNNPTQFGSRRFFEIQTPQHQVFYPRQPRTACFHLGHALRTPILCFQDSGKPPSSLTSKPLGRPWGRTRESLSHRMPQHTRDGLEEGEAS